MTPRYSKSRQRLPPLQAYNIFLGIGQFHKADEIMPTEKKVLYQPYEIPNCHF